MLGSDILEILGASPIMLGVLTLLWKGDEVISGRAREDLSAHLLALDARSPVADGKAPWVGFVRAQFERFFGPRHLSMRCIMMSILVSIGALAALYVSVAIMNPEFTSPSLGGAGVWLAVLTAVLIALPFNLFFDWLSLIETRAILGSDGFPRRPTLYLLVDFLFTILIFAAGFYITFQLLWLTLGMALGEQAGTGGMSDAISPLTFYANSWESFTTANAGEKLTWFGHRLELVQVAFLLPFLTTFTTSLWLWVAATGTLLLHGLSRLQPMVRLFRYALPVEEKPVRCIGIAAAIIVFIVLMIIGSFG